MKKVTKSLRSIKTKKSSAPHISIARKLKPDNLEIAKHLFTAVNTSFLCDTIVLREYNPIIKQFFITNTFTFNNNPQPDFIQGKLF